MRALIIPIDEMMNEMILRERRFALPKFSWKRLHSRTNNRIAIFFNGLDIPALFFLVLLFVFWLTVPYLGQFLFLLFLRQIIMRIKEIIFYLKETRIRKRKAANENIFDNLNTYSDMGFEIVIYYHIEMIEKNKLDVTDFWDKMILLSKQLHYDFFLDGKDNEEIVNKFMEIRIEPTSSYIFSDGRITLLMETELESI